jgi:diguanylate cyclase (GGDEF)-like protein
MRMQRDSKLWTVAAVGLTVAQIFASLLLPRGIALTAISDSVSGLLMLSLVLAFARNAIYAEGRLRSVWILQSACWSFWLADQGAWFFYDVVLQKPMPEMFPGDVVLFLAGVPMLAGLLLRPHLQPSERSVRLGILDFLQLMLWWIYLYVYIVMCWQYVTQNPDLYNRNYDGLYLIEVLVLVATLGFLVQQSKRDWKRFYTLFLGAVLFNCLAVVAENRAIEQKAYFTGCWYDTPLVASIAFFMVVAIKGRTLRPAPETAKDESYGFWIASLAAVAVLSLPVIIVANAVNRSAPQQIVRFRELITAVTMFVMALLVFIQQRRLHRELKRTNVTLEEASMTDPLTGIRNRRYFAATVAGDVAQALRAYLQGSDRSTRDLVFYLIDIDNFKQVNDLYGHDAGDRVLVETARRITSAIRTGDVVLRWGGEEFLVISRSTDRMQAATLAQRVMQAISERPFAVNASREIRRTCSIGWAAFPWLEDDVEATSYEEVINMADRALIQAKKAGKNRALAMTPSSIIPCPAPHCERDADPLDEELRLHLVGRM